VGRRPVKCEPNTFWGSAIGPQLQRGDQAISGYWDKKAQMKKKEMFQSEIPHRNDSGRGWTRCSKNCGGGFEEFERVYHSRGRGGETQRSACNLSRAWQAQTAKIEQQDQDPQHLEEKEMELIKRTQKFVRHTQRGGKTKLLTYRKTTNKRLKTKTAEKTMTVGKEGFVGYLITPQTRGRGKKKIPLRKEEINV